MVGNAGPVSPPGIGTFCITDSITCCLIFSWFSSLVNQRYPKIVPPVNTATSTKETTLKALTIFCMGNVWRDAFLRALTPVIVIVFMGIVSLLPLYVITQSSLPRKTPPLPARLLQ